MRRGSREKELDQRIDARRTKIDKEETGDKNMTREAMLQEINQFPDDVLEAFLNLMKLTPGTT